MLIYSKSLIYTYIFKFACLVILQSHAAEAPSSVTNNTINHGVTFNPNFTANPIQTQTVIIKNLLNLNIVIECIQEIYTKTSVKVSQYVQQWQQNWWYPQEYYEQGRNKLYAYRYHIIAALAAALYGSCYYKLKAAERYLASSRSWSVWQNRYTTEKLCALDPETLGANLIRDIQMEFAVDGNPTDFITPFVHFLKVLHKEISICENLLTWHTWLARLYICRVFPRVQCMVNELKNRLDRLTCVKRIFLHWIATYNIAHNKKDSLAAHVT